MATTVLNLVKSACYSIGITAPSALTTSTNAYELQLHHILKQVGRYLRSKRCFPQQKKIYTFSTSNGTASYQLPQDYYAALPATQWDHGLQMRLIGPLSDSDFTDRTRGQIGSVRPFAWRIFGPDHNPNSAGGQFKVDPTPSATITLSFEYISGNTFSPPHWTASEAGITVNKYRNANGIYYKCSAVTTGTTGSTAPSHTSGTAVDGGVTWQVPTTFSDLANPNCYDEPATDSDFSLFDDELVISELIWRFLEAEKKDYAEKKAEAAELLDRTVARFHGSHVGRMDGPKGRSERYSVAYGGWDFS